MENDDVTGELKKEGLSVWLPIWKLACIYPIEQRGVLDRMGAPRGLPRDQWPRCKLCAAPMTFLGQFAHDPERLDLGSPGRVLYAFVCTNPETVLKLPDGSDGCGYSSP